MFSTDAPLWRWFRLPFALRVFVLYFIFVGLSGYFMLDLVVKEIKPAVRQSTEEVLFDTAQLLASLVAADLQQQQVPSEKLQQVFSSYGIHRSNAKIWGVAKPSIPHRIYITDQQGVVVYDSTGMDVGKDYSRWNDVYLTLRGHYGARSSKANPQDEHSTVMHVAAPVLDQQNIIGVLTIAKPNTSMQPFIDKTQDYLIVRAVLLMLLGLSIGALLAWRLQRGLNQLEAYASALSDGERVGPPRFRLFFEFTRLTKALDKMRRTLAGQAYVEQYVQTLTHELKSPLTAIQAASELLQQPLPAHEHCRFATNIQQQSQRLHQILEQLLHLSALEQQPHLQTTNQVPLHELCLVALQQRQGRIDQQDWQLTLDLIPLSLEGDAILLQQAIGHLLDNALDFAPKQAKVFIQLVLVEHQVELSLFNQGPAIPDYALPRLTERFYSLPRPQHGAKSTGLGLNFVAEVVKLHQGQLHIENCQYAGLTGVMVKLRFPSELR